MRDIETSGDILLLVNTFYNRLLQHEDIKTIFAHVDLPAHIPHIAAFWEFVLLDKAGYKTNVFDKHVNLPLKAEHFETWLKTFTETVHDLFEGAKAELAILRANSIAFSFQQKLKAMGKL